MEIEILKRIIEEQRNEIDLKFKSGTIIQREYTLYVKKFIEHPNIVVVLGVRRSGKSIFSMLLANQQNAAYINFDDERLVGIAAEDLDKVLQAFYELYAEPDIIILDEIQNVDAWELFANRLRRTKKVIVTGSNSKLLSGELATHLTGRHIDFTLYPFSFKESLTFKPNKYLVQDIAKVRNQLQAYLQGSGFPEFAKFGSSIVVKIYEDILTKDCIQRHKIKNEKTFKELASYLLSNFSNEFTYSKLSRIFGIKDVHTTKNYVEYLKEAFLVLVLERFSPKLKQQIIAPKKAYAIDHGFCNFVSFRLSQDLGRVFENIVCVELLREKAKDYSMGVYYWKGLRQEEVDFVVKKGVKIDSLIQVCYNIDDATAKEREVKALLNASNELRCNNLIVITAGREGEETIKSKKVKYFPLWKWLLRA